MDSSSSMKSTVSAESDCGSWGIGSRARVLYDDGSSHLHHTRSLPSHHPNPYRSKSPRWSRP